MNIFTTTRTAARRWFLRKLEPCQAMVPVMSQSLERQLGLVERTKLRLHLLVCAWCARYLTQIKLIKQALSQHEFRAGDSTSPLKLTDAARQRISESLRNSL